jgi:hypothetical protein
MPGRYLQVGPSDRSLAWTTGDLPLLRLEIAEADPCECDQSRSLVGIGAA